MFYNNAAVIDGRLAVLQFKGGNMSENALIQASIHKKLATVIGEGIRFASHEIFNYVLEVTCDCFKEAVPILDDAHKTGLTPRQAIIVALMLETADEKILRFQKVAWKIYEENYRSQLTLNPEFVDPAYTTEPDFEDNNFKEVVEDYIERARSVTLGRSDFTKDKKPEAPLLSSVLALRLASKNRGKLAAAVSIPHVLKLNLGSTFADQLSSESEEDLATLHQSLASKPQAAAVLQSVAEQKRVAVTTQPDLNVRKNGHAIHSIPKNLNNDTSNRLERPMQKTSTIRAAQTGMSYSEYLASFGFKLQEQREDRQITRDTMATTVLQSAADGEKVTAENIKHWEQARGELPSETQFQALLHVLVNENQKIAGQHTVRAEFQTAYTKSLTAKASPSQAQENDLYLFADKLIELVESATLMGPKSKREKLAAKINDNLKSQLIEDETALLNKDKGKYIAGIEAGIIKPSKNLMILLMKTLDTLAALGAAKQELLKAYGELPNSDAEPAKSFNGNGHPSGEDNGHDMSTRGQKIPKRFSTEEPTDPILKLKFQFRQVVDVEHDKLRTLSKKTGVNQTTLNVLFAGVTNPVKASGFSLNVRSKLTDYIGKIYSGEPQKVALFKNLYEELERVCRAQITPI